MGKISNKDLYPTPSSFDKNDFLLGTDGESRVTENFPLENIQQFLQPFFTPDILEQEADNGNLHAGVWYGVNDVGDDNDIIAVRAITNSSFHKICVKLDDPNSFYNYDISQNTLTPYTVGGGVEEAPSDGFSYNRINLSWARTSIQSDAPIDSKQYARKNGAWEVVVGGGDGVSESPTDGQSYARNGSLDSWFPTYTKEQSDANFDANGSAAAVQSNLTQHAANPDIHFGDAPMDNFRYVRFQLGWVKVDEPQDNGSFFSRKTDGDESSWVENPIQEDAPLDENYYSRKDGDWHLAPIQNLPPQDGSTYGLNNGNWSKFPIQTDAPQDGQTWGRKNGDWIAVTSSVDSSDYVMSSYPQDGEPISSTEIPLITLNNPSFLQDGTTPIDSTNIDSLITLEQDPNGTPTSFPFDATVDYSRRVISVTPTTEFTKGEEYQLTCSALKDSEGDQSGSINVSFTATYTPGFQAILDKIESNGETAPSNLNDLEALYIAMDNLGLFTNGSLVTFNLSRVSGTQSGIYGVNWVNPDGFPPLRLSNTEYFENQGSKGTSTINGGLLYTLTPELIAAIRANTYRTLFDRFDSLGGALDYIAGVNGNGTGFGSSTSVRTRHDANGISAGVRFATTQKNNSWDTLLDTSGLNYAIGGVNRGTSTTSELSNTNAVMGFVATTIGFEPYLSDFKTVYNQYLTTL
tara:strand:+ start:104 stop:2173 length:2070 start_codon:yes stop_codon:yes gene_type:complete